MSARSVFRGVATAVVLLIIAFGVVSIWSPAWWQRIIYPLVYRAEIERYSAVNDLDPYLVTAVIYVESGFNPQSRSRAGARGLMQLIPSTAKEAAEQLGEKDFEVEMLDDPKTNIRYGTWYLRHLLERYGSVSFALAAYNGGGSNMDRWLKGNDDKSERQVVEAIPFRETREFVGRVRMTEKIYRRLYPGSFK